MSKRASPAELRKALEIAHFYVKMGIHFVPVPVATEEDLHYLQAHALAKLEEIAQTAEAEESLGASGRAQRTNNNKED